MKIEDYPNGFVFYCEDAIERRNNIVRLLKRAVEDVLLAENQAWRFYRIEAPLIVPTELVSKEYQAHDYFRIDNFYSLRPETTAGSYVYLRTFMNTHNKLWRPPICVWQAGKSFRREQDQPLSKIRYKEFYQQEFQCVYSDTTKNDYHERILDPLAERVESIIQRPVYVQKSDRLPSYSERTTDLVVDGMEICSISTRNDFEEGYKVLEIAFGLDRVEIKSSY